MSFGSKLEQVLSFQTSKRGPKRQKDNRSGATKRHQNQKNYQCQGLYPASGQTTRSQLSLERLIKLGSRSAHRGAVLKRQDLVPSEGRSVRKTTRAAPRSVVEARSTIYVRLESSNRFVLPERFAGLRLMIQAFSAHPSPRLPHRIFGCCCKGFTLP